MTPTASDDLFNRGCALQSQGKLDEAIQCFREAIAVQPNHAFAHSNLAGALINKGQFAEAMVSCRRALELKPDLAVARYNLGRLLFVQERLEEAIGCFREALLTMRSGMIHNDLGVALQNVGRIDEAIASYREAVRLEPAYAPAHFNLGNLLHDKAHWEEASACYRQAIRLAPGFVDAYTRLGSLLYQKQQLAAAIECFQKALQLNPNHADARANLGLCQFARGQLDDAIGSYREALRFRPDLAYVWNNLGMALTQSGELAESLLCYRKALELRPRDATIHSNLIFGMLYPEDPTNHMEIEECRRWRELHAPPLPTVLRPHGNSRDPERRLRIGYVSPDFRNHPAARCLLPLLENHDRRNFGIICYFNFPTADAVTKAMRLHADQWRDVIGAPDQHMAELIRQDQIDILVDLAMHSNHNRLGVFALKPAPVQATWLAYPGTTGLEAIDYRISDPYLDPDCANPPEFAEQTLRLPETFWCCLGGAENLPVNDLPGMRDGRVTFGSLNNFSKVTPKAIETWAAILREVPGSRLVLHAHAGKHRERVHQMFAELGVTPERCEFVARLAVGEYFALHQRIDLGLDSLPFGGGLTTCDALWMGVPVVSVAGKVPWHRSGASILSNVGLTELIAQTPEEYVRIAVNLTNDLPRLAEIRAGLRERMRNSPLMDAPRFARNLEAAYRTMWRKWCAKAPA
jgi:protein O-GlcNAc transferase